MLLLTALWGTWVAGLDRLVWLIILCFGCQCLPPVQGGSDLAFFQVELVTYKSKTCLGSSSDFSMFTSQLRSLQRATSVCVFWRQVGRIWPGTTSRLGTGGFLYPSVRPSIWPLGHYSELQESLNWYVALYMKSQIFSWLVLYGYMEVGVLEIYGRDPFPCLGMSGSFLMSPFWIFPLEEFVDLHLLFGLWDQKTAGCKNPRFDFRPTLLHLVC